MSDEATTTAETPGNTEQSEAVSAPILGGESDSAAAEVSQEATPSEVTDEKPIEQTSILGDAPEKQDEKPGEPEKPDEKPDEKPKEEEPEKPIVYEDLKVPEGMEIDKGLQDVLLPIMAKNKLPQESVQELFDAYNNLQVERSAEMQKVQAERVESNVKAWQEKLTSDPKYKENLVLAQKGKARIVKEFPETNDLFNDPVFGNMPQLFKIAQFVGKTMESEATLLSGNKQGEEKGFLDKLYDNMN